MAAKFEELVNGGKALMGSFLASHNFRAGLQQRRSYGEVHV